MVSVKDHNIFQGKSDDHNRIHESYKRKKLAAKWPRGKVNDMFLFLAEVIIFFV